MAPKENKPKNRNKAEDSQKDIDSRLEVSNSSYQGLLKGADSHLEVGNSFYQD